MSSSEITTFWQELYQEAQEGLGDHRGRPEKGRKRPAGTDRQVYQEGR